MLQVSQYDRCGGRHSKKEEAGERPTQIASALCDDLWIGSEKAQHLSWSHPHHGRKDQGDQQAATVHQGQGFTQAGHFPSAPVPGNEDAGAHTHSHRHELEQTVDLGGRCAGGQGRFIELAQHHGVHHVNANRNDLLKGNRTADGQYLFIKCEILYK